MPFVLGLAALGGLVEYLESKRLAWADGFSHGSQRAIAQAIEGLRARQGGDIDYPSGYAAVNEVQGIAIHEAGVDAGTFSLTIDLKDVAPFTTAALAFNANAATIEAAIDTAAGVAAVPGFVAGDISISGGPLTTTPLVLTYDGASVAGKNHGEVVINNIDLNDGGVPEAAGDESTTTEGQTNRSALAVLRALGVLAGAPPVQDEGSTVTAGTINATNPAWPGEEVIRALAAEAAVQDRVAALETNILLAHFVSDLTRCTFRLRCPSGTDAALHESTLRRTRHACRRLDHDARRRDRRNGCGSLAA